MIRKNLNQTQPNKKKIKVTHEKNINQINEKIKKNLKFLNNPYIKNILLTKKLLSIKSKYDEDIIKRLIKIYLEKNKKKYLNYNDYCYLEKIIN
tara:strand:- start:148 stop:429 length:282 start_codon:yes stop_codon:yes gene_type:complete